MKRSKHSLSNYKLLTMDQASLVPIGLTEVLPGDTVQHATSALVRVSPLLSPVMHPVHIRIHHWFVPHRLVWDNGIDDGFEPFITGGHDGLDASVFPTITPNTGSGYAVGSLSDYLGVPTGVDDLAHSALPYRGYALIWNEFYRDQDLQTPLVISKNGGADTTTSVALQNVAWEKDYFTSSRPWAQKGPAVSLPLGVSAKVTTTTAAQMSGVQSAIRFLKVNGGAPDNNTAAFGDGVGTFGQTGTAGTVTSGVYPENLIADLSTATAATINELREALAIQRYEEARARYGSRYTEYLRYLGIRNPSDARLQRPEYLAGGKQTISFSEILQTSNTTSGTPSVGVGTMMGHGIGAIRSNRYRRFFEEHGYIFSLMSVLPKTIYVNGLPRHWSRTTKEDFYQKELEHIGQQEVKYKEVYWAHATPDGTFGYQDRYDEYRRTESTVAGEFRTTLNMWHMARIFGSDPALNSTFVSANPTNRIYQSTSTDQLYVMAMHSMQARRLVAKAGTSSIH